MKARRIVGTVIVVAAGLYLAFVAGIVAVVYEVFPGPWLESKFLEMKSLAQLRGEWQAEPGSNYFFWTEPRKKETGTLTYNEELTQPGYTLYFAGDLPGARLIDQDGKVIHQWSKPFSEVWPNPGRLQRFAPDNLIVATAGHVYPNGDLLLIYFGWDRPFGYGIAKLDKDSNVIWARDERAHHDVTVGDDGRIYALTHEFKEFPRTVVNYRSRSAIYNDYVVVLSPEGDREETIDVFKVLTSSELGFNDYVKEIFEQQSVRNFDPTHTNAAKVVTEEWAQHYEEVSPGDIMISMRTLSMIAVLSRRTHEIVWATWGSWRHQHDPDMLPDGQILLFDNAGDLAGEGTRVVEFDPRTQAVTWSYSTGFGNRYRGEQQRLENGNTLLSDTAGSRFLEVTRDGQIVWEYSIPVRSEAGKGPWAWRAKRIPKAYFTFLTD